MPPTLGQAVKLNFSGYVIGGIYLEIKLITKPPFTCNPEVAAIGG